MTSTSPSAPDRASLLAPWIGGALLALPVLVARYPPMSDLPLHEASVGLLRHWGDPHFAPPTLYFLNLGHSNQLFSLLCYSLSFLVPIAWASKIVVAGALLGLSVAAGHFADHVGAPRWTALLVAPVGLGWLFFWGMIQNILGLVVLLAILPALDRFASHPTVKGAVSMCAAMLLLHFAHQAMQLVALMALVFCSVGTARDVKGIALRAVPVVFCALVVYAASVYAWRFAGPLHHAMKPFTWTALSYKLVTIPGVLFAGYEAYVRNLMMLLVMVPVVLLGIERVRARSRDGHGWTSFVHEWRFELLALTLVVLFFAAPSTIKSTTMVYHRFLPPAWAVLAVTAGSRTAAVARFLPRALCALGPVGSLLTSWPTFVDSHHIYSDLDALLPYIEEGSAVASIDMGPDPPNRLWGPMVIAGHVVAVKGGRSLFDYTVSPVSPVTQRANKMWSDTLLRTQNRVDNFMPGFDLTRYRYLLVITPDHGRATIIGYSLRNDATLLAWKGDLYLYESTHPLVPVDADDAVPEKPYPPTLRELLKRSARELQAVDSLSPTPGLAEPPR